jgi:hypothetical protein
MAKRVEAALLSDPLRPIPPVGAIACVQRVKRSGRDLTMDAIRCKPHLRT